jgi:site-specific DNA-methyltransferase (adenine-specific)
MRTDEWETPDALFGALHAEFSFTIDVCASPTNAKLPRYWTRADDALLRDWTGERCWMNPPYGRQIGRWIRKAYQEARGGGRWSCASSRRAPIRRGGTSTARRAKSAFSRGGYRSREKTRVAGAAGHHSRALS